MQPYNLEISCVENRFFSSKKRLKKCKPKFQNVFVKLAVHMIISPASP